MTQNLSSLRIALVSMLITLFAFSAVTYTSCKKDKCKDVTCQNGGTCTDGSCSCPTGFTGTNCETGFVGTWHGTDCNGAATTFIISAGNSANTVSLLGEAGSGNCYRQFNVYCTVSGNTMTLPGTIFTDACGAEYSYSGTGVINGNTLNVNIVFHGITAGLSVNNCFNGTK